MPKISAIPIQLVGEIFCWWALSFRSSRSIKAENLLLRRQLGLHIERGVKPRRIDPVTRISLTVLSRLFSWRDALVVVRPETLIRWHRAGWRLFWRLKSRPGRPPIPQKIQALIRRLARENPLWGEERIPNELLLKLGIRLSPRTVRKYLPRRPTRRPRGRSTMVNLSPTARSGNHCLRFLRRGDRNVSPAVRVRGDQAPQPTPGPLQRYKTSECRLDLATAA
jgi:putative transposase